MRRLLKVKYSEICKNMLMNILKFWKLNCKFFLILKTSRISFSRDVAAKAIKFGNVNLFHNARNKISYPKNFFPSCAKMFKALKHIFT